MAERSGSKYAHNTRWKRSIITALAAVKAQRLQRQVKFKLCRVCTTLAILDMFKMIKPIIGNIKPRPYHFIIARQPTHTLRGPGGPLAQARQATTPGRKNKLRETLVIRLMYWCRPTRVRMALALVALRCLKSEKDTCLGAVSARLPLVVPVKG